MTNSQWQRYIKECELQGGPVLLKAPVYQITNRRMKEPDMDTTTLNRPVAITALSHWLKAWPITQEEADLANKTVCVLGWEWVYNPSRMDNGSWDMDNGSWEFQRETSHGIQFITEFHWSDNCLKLAEVGVPHG